MAGVAGIRTLERGRFIGTVPIDPGQCGPAARPANLFAGATPLHEAAAGTAVRLINRKLLYGTRAVGGENDADLA